MVDTSVADESRTRVHAFRQYMEDEVKQRVKESNIQVKNYLKEIEDNYCKSIQAQIDHHKNTMAKTSPQSDPVTHGHAKVMFEIYSQMLENYTHNRQSL